MYSFTSQRTVVPLVVLQSITGDIEVLEVPGLTIEVPELIVGRVFLSEYSQGITILLLEHHCVGSHQRLFLRGVEELI